MDEMTKRKKADQEKNLEKAAAEPSNSAARDQRENKYYYDDAHGYEIYNPETEDEEKDENQ